MLNRGISTVYYCMVTMCWEGNQLSTSQTPVSQGGTCVSNFLLLVVSRLGAKTTKMSQFETALGDLHSWTSKVEKYFPIIKLCRKMLGLDL